jgi:hypothetical protein
MSYTIFLDIDGVLNTFQTNQQSLLSEECVINLYYLLLATNSHIVISSDWRLSGIGEGSAIHQSLKQVCSKLNDGQGKFNFIWSRIVGRTDLDDRVREDLILSYVKEHNIRNFIALDDTECHFPSKPPWLILTDSHVGFDLEKFTLTFDMILNKDLLTL